MNPPTHPEPDPISAAEQALDQELAAAFRVLDPPPDRAARLEQRVLRAVEIEQRSLAAEWLDLVSAGPVWSAARMTLAAAGLAIASPLGTALLLVLLLR
jgi:hypothetical protein